MVVRPAAAGGNARTTAGAEAVVTAGLVAALAALVVGTAVGLVWRASNGKMRAPRRPRSQYRPAPAEAAPSGPSGPVSSGPMAPGRLAVDTATAELDSAEATAAAAGGRRVTTAEIGQPLGQRATLLQFSSAFCAPCRATRRVLAEVADMTEGIAHVEIDAESHLDLVRELGILRTPTVLVLAADGRIVRRASGQPRKVDVIGALGAAVEAGNPNSYPAGLESG
jgi:thiol-disulfide isomerase/thioredoxin